MSRVDTMLDRLPPPLTIDEGSVVRDVIALVDGHLQVFDEDLDRIQRSHWIGFATDVRDLARLGALFDVRPAAWEPLPMYRARLQAEVTALLSGSVTVAHLAAVTERIVAGAREAFAMPAGPPPSIDEWPDRTGRSPDLLSRRGRLRVHDRVEVRNRGLDPAPAQIAIIGAAGGATAMPVVVNRTSGRALGWRGVVPAGRTLRFVTSGATVRASLDGDDASDAVWSTAAYGPEVTDDVEPAPLVLERGVNVVSVETMGRYGEPGTDHAGFGVTDPDIVQASFAGGDHAGAPFDDAVFTTGTVAGVDIHWVERSPAAFDVNAGWGAVARVARRRPDPEGDRDALRSLLQERVDRLRGSAVAARVRLRPLAETQRSLDRLTVLSPVATVEHGSAGREGPVDTEARFDEIPRSRGRLA